MEIIRLFFQGYRKYVSIGVLLVASYFIFSRIRAIPGTLEIPLKKTTILRTVYGLGTVQAERVYNLMIGVSTNIQRLYVREGDTVKKGAPLILFDQVPLMRAPFPGIISAIKHNEGESVFPQNTVLTLMDLSEKYISASLDEKSAVLVQKKQKVRIAFEGIMGKTFTGEISTVYPADGQFMIQVKSSELPAEVIPGMSADLAIEAGKKENVYVAPIKSIKEGKIRVLRAEKKLVIPVQLGLTQGDLVEIVSSEIKDGDILRY